MGYVTTMCSSLVRTESKKGNIVCSLSPLALQLSYGLLSLLCFCCKSLEIIFCVLRSERWRILSKLCNPILCRITYVTEFHLCTLLTL